MNLCTKSLTVCCLLFSAAAMSDALPRSVTVISAGKSVATFDVPASAKIDISADSQKTEANKNHTNFKGDAKMSLTFSSGEVINIHADEFDIVSAAG